MLLVRNKICIVMKGNNRNLISDNVNNRDTIYYLFQVKLCHIKTSVRCRFLAVESYVE